jgi:hypothetical protein
MWSTMATDSWPDSARLIASGSKCGDRVFDNSSEAALLGLTKCYLLNIREPSIDRPTRIRLAGPACKPSKYPRGMIKLRTQPGKRMKVSSELGSFGCELFGFASPWGKSLPKSLSDQIDVLFGSRMHPDGAETLRL